MIVRPEGRRGAPSRGAQPDWSRLRLRDRIRPGVRVLFVGINPGVRSALTGHHFAGYSNRFWKLLFESGLVPEPITFEQDDRLPDFGFGITNLIARPSPASTTSARRSMSRAGGFFTGRSGATARRSPRSSGSRSTARWFRSSSITTIRSGPEGRGGAEIAAVVPGRPAGSRSWRSRVRAAEPQRPQRQFHLRRDARGVQGVAAGDGEGRTLVASSLRRKSGARCTFA